MYVEIHGRVGCPFAWRARLAAAEKGVPFRCIAWDTNPPQEGAERNPDHRSPLLIDGDLRLTESMVIAAYLDEAFVGPPLQPEAPRERALMRVAMAELEGLGLQRHDSAEVSDAERPRLERALASLERWLGGRDFVGGVAPGLADIQAAPMLARLVLMHRYSLPEGAVADYWSRWTQRPSLRMTVPPWAASLVPPSASATADDP